MYKTHRITWPEPRQAPVVSHEQAVLGKRPATATLILGTVLLLGPGSGNALAQTTPDAGALRQQIEGKLPQALPDEQKPLKSLPPEFKPVPGLSITVREFRFAGNTLISTEKLAPVVAAYLNRPIDFAELRRVTSAVSEAYRAAGWVVHVYLPRQEIRDGIVTLQIVEGLFGKLRFDGSPATRLAPGRADAFVANAQAGGKPLNAAALDRAMLLLDDLPGVAVSGNLVPGGGQAETDLLLKLADEPVVSGDAAIDNTGSRATGTDRIAVSAFLNSPLQFGDQAIANLIHTDGSDYLRLAYSLPIGHDGWRLGLNSSVMNYRVISAEFLAAKLSGGSTTWGVDAQYPLIRSRTRNLYVSATYDDKAFDNLADGAINSRYNARNLTLGLSGNLFDKWGGGGANAASLYLTAGSIDLDGSPNKAADATTTQAHGNFTKLRYSLSRQQVITPLTSVFAMLSGQFADKNLDSSEKFYLGGSNGVRAYPSSEGGGSEGAMLNLELRYRMTPTLVLTGFYDTGTILINKKNNYTGAPALNRYALDGAGVSVAWTGPLGVTLKGVYARRLSNNPNPTATGKDQDGSLTRDRVWLTASLPF